MINRSSNFDWLKNTFGPGILFASTAIGVSHLVQSTRAGANYGFGLLIFIIIANLFKYPFFEFASRYSNSTGKSIIEGYELLGRWVLWFYLIITLISMFFITSAVGAVTAGFLQNLFGISHWGIWSTLGLFCICTLILMLGKYKILDSMIKIIGAVLLLSTLLAFVLALVKGPSQQIPNFLPEEIWSDKSIIFIIALMGWMPTAVDLSAWNSLWTIERIKQTGYKPKLKETLADFNFGYIISVVLSICFVTLGSYMMFGTGKVLPNSSGPFANSVVEMFTTFIGSWSYFIIAIASFCIMFGTCIAVFDGYSRSIKRSAELLFFNKGNSNKNIYSISLFIVVLGAFGIVFFLGNQLKQLVDLATTISFLIAPIIAIVNYKLVTSIAFPKDAHPKLWLKILSYLGILFLSGFALYFIWIKI